MLKKYTFLIGLTCLFCAVAAKADYGQVCAKIQNWTFEPLSFSAMGQDYTLLTEDRSPSIAVKVPGEIVFSGTSGYLVFTQSRVQLARSDHQMTYYASFVAPGLECDKAYEIIVY